MPAMRPPRRWPAYQPISSDRSWCSGCWPRWRSPASLRRSRSPPMRSTIMWRAASMARRSGRPGIATSRPDSRFCLTCKPLLIFAAATVLFHFANAAMLPLVGQKLALVNRELGTTLMSVCIVAAQLVMVPVAMLVGRKADVWGRKPIFATALAVLALRGALYPLSDNPYWLVGVQLLDGVGAGIFGALFPLVVADLTRGTGHFNVSQGAIATAAGLGGALSAAAAGFIVVAAGYSAAFLFLAAIAAVALALFVVMMPETGPNTAGVGWAKRPRSAAGPPNKLQPRNKIGGHATLCPPYDFDPGTSDSCIQSNRFRSQPPLHPDRRRRAGRAAAIAAPGTRRRMADAAGKAGGAVRGRRHHRHPGAGGRGKGVGRIRPAVHRREQGRRRRQYRRRRGREGRTRRLHLHRRHAGHARDQPVRVQGHALRPDQGHRAGDHHRAGGEPVLGDQLAAGQIGRGTDRLCEIQARRIVLRHARPRQHRASVSPNCSSR